MNTPLQLLVFDHFDGSGNALVLALVLAGLADEEGKGISITVQAMAYKGRQSESCARRSIDRLIESGWLVRANRGKGGRGVANEYEINPEWIKTVRAPSFHVEHRRREVGV